MKEWSALRIVVAAASLCFGCSGCILRHFHQAISVCNRSFDEIKVQRKLKHPNAFQLIAPNRCEVIDGFSKTNEEAILIVIRNTGAKESITARADPNVPGRLVVNVGVPKASR